jgi:predicted RND superfamily exporter protein
VTVAVRLASRAASDRGRAAGGGFYLSRALVGLVDRHRWAVVAVFLVACGVAVYVHATRARYDMTYRTMAPRHTPEAALFEDFVKVFGEANDVFVIGFRDVPLLTPGNLSTIDRITRRIEELVLTHSVTSLTNARDILGRDGTLDVVDFVEEIPQGESERMDLEVRLASDPVLAGGLISRDATTTAILVRIAESRADQQEWSRYFDEIARILREEGGDRISFHLAGYPYIGDVLMRYMIDDTTRFIPLVLLVMCGFLWLAFGRLRATWMPLVPVLVAASLSLGALTATGLPMSLLTGQGVLTTLIMVIGISDGIHLLNRYGEDSAADSTARSTEVLRTTLRHVGRACFLTSLTTAIGLVSLAVADVPSVRDFGIFAALGVGFAYLGAIVLLPALMLIIERGRRAEPRSTRAARAIDRALVALAGFVPRHRRAIISCSCGILVVAFAGIPFARIDGRPTLDLKPADVARRSLDFFEKNLGGAYQLEIVVDGGRRDGVKDPVLLAAVDHVKAGLESLVVVSRVTSPVEFIKKMNRAMEDHAADSYRLPASSNAVAQYLLLFEMAGSDSEFERLVNYDYSIARMIATTIDITPAQYEMLRDEVDRLKTGRMPAGTDLYVSGEGPLWQAAARILISTLVRSLYIAMPLVFVVTGLAFRSTRLGLISVLPNVLPITFALALMAPLDITLRFSTITAFPLAFGLAVDDTIHFLARYECERAAGQTNHDAVCRTITTAGRAMFLTSALLVAGFSVLFVSNFVGIVHVTLLMCVILLVALIGDLVLLPALLLTFPPSQRT